MPKPLTFDYWLYRANTNNRRAQRIGADGEVTPEELEALWVQSEGKCYWCGCRTELGNKQRRGSLPLATIDHVISMGNGGPNVVENLVIACKPCNSARGSRAAGRVDGFRS